MKRRVVFFFIFLFFVSCHVGAHYAIAATKTSGRELTDLKIAIGAYEDGLYKIASEYFKKFLEKYPHSRFKKKVAILFANSLDKTGKVDDAIKAYINALHLFRNDDVAGSIHIHDALARLYLRKGKKRASIEQMRIIVRLSLKKKFCDEKSCRSFFFLSDEYKGQKNFHKSERLLNQLLSLSPPSPCREKALLRKVELLSLEKKFDKITRILRPIVKNLKGLDELSRRFVLYWAVSNLELKRYCVAQKAYLKLIKSSMDTPTTQSVVTGFIVSSYNCFADKTVREEMFEGLRKKFQKRMSILFQINYIEGLLNFNEGNFEKSKLVWLKTIQNFPDHPKIPEILLKLDVVFRSLKNLKDWETTLIKIRTEKKCPSGTKEIASLLLANLYFSKGKYETALPFYFSLINRKRFRKFCLRRIVFCYYYLGKYHEAMTNLGILLLENPQLTEQMDIMFLRADLLLRLQKTDAAFKIFKKIMLRGKNSSSIWKEKATLELGKIYFFRKDFLNAKRYLSDVLKQPLKDVENYREAAFYLGLMAQSENNLELSETYFQIAVLSKNPKVKLEALFRLGCVTKDLKYYSESETIFLKIITQYPHNNKWYDLSRLLLSEVYLTRKNFEKAVSLLNTLIKTTKDEEIRKRAKRDLNKIKSKRKD